MLEAVRIHREAETLARQLKCTVSSNGSIGNKTDVWRLENEPWQAVHGAGEWVGSVKTHSTYRLATHELQDDKLSVRKATKRCKTQGFSPSVCCVRGQPPPFTQHVATLNHLWLVVRAWSVLSWSFSMNHKYHNCMMLKRLKQKVQQQPQPKSSEPELHGRLSPTKNKS